MLIDVLPLLDIIGSLSIFMMLMVLALLSRRLGSVTRSAPYYVGLYIAALLMAVSLLFKILSKGGNITFLTQADQDVLMLVIYAVLPAAALTIAVIMAWRYWSWLLAERG